MHGAHPFLSGRRGRSYRTPGSNECDSNCGAGLCAIVGVAIFLAVPILSFRAEVRQAQQLAALLEVKAAGVGPLTGSTQPGSVVGVTSSDGTLRGTVHDVDFGVHVSGALKLKRVTEYCQWAEIQHQRCETCTRSVSGKDGSSRTESYRCNCVTSYQYIKQWRSYRIQSAFFNQPFNHNNPQRDPFPSMELASNDASIVADGNEKLIVALDRSLLKQVRAAWRGLVWTVGGVTPPASESQKGWLRGNSRDAPSPEGAGWFGSGSRKRTRYENISALSALQGPSLSNKDNFYYVGQGGYFYSPYEPDAREGFLKRFGQLAEGSLFDWQLGDLVPSCTAGDIRTRFAVQDPKTVSVLGEVTSTKSDQPALLKTKALSSLPTVRLKAHRTSAGMNTRGKKIGLVYAGRFTPNEMISVEERHAHRATAWMRLLLFAWSTVAARLVGVAWTGADAWDRPMVCWLPAAAGTGSLVLAVCWTLISFWSTHSEQMALLAWVSAAAVTGMLLLVYAFRGAHAPPPRVRPGLRAAWCMFARMIGLSPSWRVEEGYVGVEAVEMVIAAAESAGDGGYSGSSGRRKGWEDDNTADASLQAWRIRNSPPPGSIGAPVARSVAPAMRLDKSQSDWT